jgi:hypothetical protein
MQKAEESACWGSGLVGCAEPYERMREPVLMAAGPRHALDSYPPVTAAGASAWVGGTVRTLLFDGREPLASAADIYFRGAAMDSVQDAGISTVLGLARGYLAEDPLVPAWARRPLKIPHASHEQARVRRNPATGQIDAPTGTAFVGFW